MPTKVIHHSLSCHDFNLNGPISAKALYRRALSYIALKDDDAAEADLVVAGGDGAVVQELARLRARKKEKRDKEKKAMRKMFA